MRRVQVGLSALLTGPRSYPPRASTAFLITADKNRTSLEFHFLPSRHHLVNRGSNANRPDTRRICLPLNLKRYFARIWSLNIENTTRLKCHLVAMGSCLWRWLSLSAATVIFVRTLTLLFKKWTPGQNLGSMLHQQPKRSQRTIKKLETHVERENFARDNDDYHKIWERLKTKHY